MRNLRMYRVEIDWPQVAEAWTDEHAGPGRLGASRGIGWREVKKPGRLIGVEHWLGLFGGAHHDDLGDDGGPNLPVDAASKWFYALSYGQVQEVTVTPVWKLANGDEWNPLPGLFDLHQLTPSQSFHGTPGPIWFPESAQIDVEPGDLLGINWNVSQRDRGAHLATRFWVRQGE